MSTNSNMSYDELKIYMTKRLRRISEYPYLKDDAFDRAMRTKGVYYQDKYFTYNFKHLF